VGPKKGVEEKYASRKEGFREGKRALWHNKRKRESPSKKEIPRMKNGEKGVLDGKTSRFRKKKRRRTRCQEGGARSKKEKNKRKKKKAKKKDKKNKSKKSLLDPTASTGLQFHPGQKRRRLQVTEKRRGKGGERLPKKTGVDVRPCESCQAGFKRKLRAPWALKKKLHDM